MEGGGELENVGDNKKDFVGMDPRCGDECVQEIVFGVSGMEVECVLVVGEGDGGVGEDFDRELRVRG